MQRCVYQLIRLFFFQGPVHRFDLEPKIKELPPSPLSCLTVQLPYRGWPNKRVIDEINKGYRLPKPDQCPYDVYRLMIECWDTNVKVAGPADARRHTPHASAHY